MATDLAARDITPGMDTAATAADITGTDMAGATMVDMADAGAVASDGDSGLVGDSGSAGAASGIRSGGERPTRTMRPTRIITTRIHIIRIGHRIVRLPPTTIGAVLTARLGLTARLPLRPTTHLTTTIRFTARTPATGSQTAMTARYPPEELRNRIRPERISRCLDRRFLFT